MNKVMLDFETFGTSPDAVVVQIGACYFDEHGNIGNTFKCNVDAESAVASGAKMDASTVYWWLSQSDAARQSILAKDKKDVYTAFKELNNFLGGAIEIWSHSTFDFVILQATMRRLQIKPNFTYRSPRDIRTLTALVKIENLENRREGIAHDALDDCKFQVKYVSQLLRALNHG